MKDPIFAQVVEMKLPGQPVFLPGINGAHVLQYFQNNSKIIAEVFLLSSLELPGDIDALKEAFDANDLHKMREAVHRIKPGFHLVGLLELENQVRRFYDLCIKTNCFEELREEYGRLWPRLRQGMDLVCMQAQLFNGNPGRA